MPRAAIAFEIFFRDVISVFDGINPASTELCTPFNAMACDATLCRSRCASSTMARNSSRVKVGMSSSIPSSPHPVTAVAVNLDPIRAIHDLLAHRLARCLSPVHHLDAMRHRYVGRIAIKRICPRHIERPRSHLHARPGYHTVRRWPSLRLHPHIPHLRSPRSRMVVKPYSRARRAFTVARMVRYSDRLLQQLLVVIRRGDIALQQNVGMGVDQTRKTCFPRKINHLRCAGVHCENLLAANFNHHISLRAIRFAINQRSTANKNRPRLGRSIFAYPAAKNKHTRANNQGLVTSLLLPER